MMIELEVMIYQFNQLDFLRILVKQNHLVYASSSSQTYLNYQYHLKISDLSYQSKLDYHFQALSLQILTEYHLCCLHQYEFWMSAFQAFTFFKKQYQLSPLKLVDSSLHLLIHHHLLVSSVRHPRLLHNVQICSVHRPVLLTDTKLVHLLEMFGYLCSFYLYNLLTNLKHCHHQHCLPNNCNCCVQVVSRFSSQQSVVEEELY